ncbi:MAG: ribosome recycling factor [Candidatus Hydrogenedentes bacterium]|nr:ribosome recycling factor [Candidatus Hydrogenedentota bacterium]
MEHALAIEAKSKMQKAIDAFKHELTLIRTGRASAALLDGVEVDAYGSKMRLNQVGTVTAPEARLIVITPWDKNLIHPIEKGIMTSGLDLVPSNDGQVVRVPIPQLNEERRKEMVKLIGKLAEEAKVSIRTTRRHEVEVVKKAQKDGEVPEDDAHKLSAHIQKITDEFCAKVDEALRAKEAEVMEV